MKKEFKWGIGLGSAIVAVGLLTVRLIKKLKKNSSDPMDNMTEDTTQETDSAFDLDQDLEPAQERSYVSLHTASQPEEDTAEDEAEDNTEEDATDSTEAEPSTDSEEEITKEAVTEE